MDLAEFRDWIAYDRIEPIGPERGDYNAANIVSAILNVHRRKGPPIRLADCTVAWAPRYKEPADPDELEARFRRMFT